MIFTLWLLIGLLATVIEFNSTKKFWYKTFGESNKGQSHRTLFFIMMPIFVAGGLLTLILVLLDATNNRTISIWYKIPKK